MKAIFFVNGPVSVAIEELPRVREGIEPGNLRVVVPASQRADFLEASRLAPALVLAYTPAVWLLLWIRLVWFLGVGPARVICLAAGRSGALKLLATALRGHVMLTPPGREGLSLGFAGFVAMVLKTIGRRRGDVCLVGSAAPATLARIVADVRRRYPDAAIHGLVSSPAASHGVDSSDDLSIGALLRACARRPRFGTLVVLWTGEGRTAWKLLPLCLPIGFRELYNENLDSCAVREVLPLFRHVIWRSRHALSRLAIVKYHLIYWRWAAREAVRNAGQRARYWWWRAGQAVEHAGQRARYWRWRAGQAAEHAGQRRRYWMWRLGDAARDLPARMKARPNRVTVVASASGLYLKAIVTDLRQRYPGAPIHAMAPASLTGRVAHLFDSWTPLAAGSTRFWRDLLSLAAGRRRSGYLVIACTNEGFHAAKLLGACLPLGLRIVYNENCDFYQVRRVRTLARHCAWRLRHRIFYQALTERRGRFLPLHLVHVALYPLRLLSGAALLLSVRLRAGWQEHAAAAGPKRPAERSVTAPAVGAETRERVTQPQFEV